MKKQNNFALLLAVMLTIVLLFGNAFALSSSYSFSMNNREVNGAKNGEFHSVNAGTVRISGRHAILEQEHVMDGETIFYELRKGSQLTYTSFGMVSAYAYGGGQYSNFSGSYNTTQSGDDYYLVISKNTIEIAAAGYGTLVS